MKVKEIKEALKKEGTVFNYPTPMGIREFKTFTGVKVVDGELVNDNIVSSIYETKYGTLSRGMNINKLGPTCITLYTFDMMGNKTIAKIKYEDVEIVTMVV